MRPPYIFQMMYTHLVSAFAEIGSVLALFLSIVRYT